MSQNPQQAAPVGVTPKVVTLREHIVEIVSDSGQGAQKAGQSFSAISAKMGNGVWTVEIIPAEIKPPSRSSAGASGIRIRIGDHNVTNMGDEADMVVALNEQVLYGRIEQGAYRRGTILLLESKWATDANPAICQAYAEAVDRFREMGLDVRELAIEAACVEITPTPQLGMNMFVLGMICEIYRRDFEIAREQIRFAFRKKATKVVEMNLELLDAGRLFAQRAIPERFQIGRWDNDKPLIVMNGNEAVGLGVMAAGIEMVAMYPITPATSASHYLAEVFHKVGGCVHQAEDEIAAIGYAIGASYAGKTACTITSGPGLALKTEFIGLAVMAEIPLVIVVVQRGGPSTGLPTKVEQGDLMAALHASPGDAPKIVIAPATIEESCHFVVTARKLAEAFRGPVMVLTDANLATGVQPFPRPNVQGEWLSSPIDQSPWKEGVLPYDWDPDTGLSPRPIPGQAGGEYVLTGLAHTNRSWVAYDPASNQYGAEMRSRKLAALQRTLRPPRVFGDEQGELLIVGWGSTLGSIEEAVERARADGFSVSALHLRFLSPLEPGLKEIFSRFERVVTVEINFSDSATVPRPTGEPRRMGQLATLLRTHTLLDIDCYSNVYGQPLRPGQVYEEIQRRLGAAGKEAR
ncbi:MAG: 2-oxoacid:acceptor oxidoreductase subunit alpha [Pseudomonadota bacterium]